MALIKAVDMFCGAGGLSHGLAQACWDLDKTVRLLAINHWQLAVDTHEHNHPWARHMCARVDDLDPVKAVGGRRLDILGAGPECTHHSNARGGRPRSDQSRASAWNVCRWAEHLRIKSILIENVKEFRDWGPLLRRGITYKRKKYRAGQPDPRKKGQTFKAFMNALCSLGYVAEDRLLCAADFGDPTTRERLFIMATDSRSGPRWPEPSHSAVGEGDKKKWVPAREIIDWEYPSQSIFRRKKPLAEGTLRRIAAGLRKFCGESAEPFLAMMYGTGSARSIDRPCPTVTSKGQHIALCQPIIVPIDNRSQEGGARSPEKPIGTITTKNRWAVCEPIILEVNHGTPEGREASRCHDIGKPLRTVTGKNGYAITQPFVVRFKGTKGKDPEYNVRDVDRPAPTVLSRNDLGLAQPCIIKYYGRDAPDSVEEPLAAVTTRDRFGLAEPIARKEGGEYYLDILFRMLQPHELAAAMSMDDFEFRGTKEQTVAQIGNAVPVKTARALCMSLLAPRHQPKIEALGDLS